VFCNRNPKKNNCDAAIRKARNRLYGIVRCVHCSAVHCSVLPLFRIKNKCDAAIRKASPFVLPHHTYFFHNYFLYGIVRRGLSYCRITIIFFTIIRHPWPHHNSLRIAVIRNSPLRCALPICVLQQT